MFTSLRNINTLIFRNYSPFLFNLRKSNSKDLINREMQEHLKILEKELTISVKKKETLKRKSQY